MFLYPKSKKLDQYLQGNQWFLMIFIEMAVSFHASEFVYLKHFNHYSFSKYLFSLFLQQILQSFGMLLYLLGMASSDASL